MPGGRPTKLTPEVQERILMAIRGGNYLETAAAYAGIGISTFKRWMGRGEKAQKGQFRAFWEAVQKARSEAEVRNVTLIQTAAKDNWQAAAWWLERSFFDRWGRKVKQELSSDPDKPLTITIKREIHNPEPPPDGVEP